MIVPVTTNQIEKPYDLGYSNDLTLDPAHLTPRFPRPTCSCHDEVLRRRPVASTHLLQGGLRKIWKNHGDMVGIPSGKPTKSELENHHAINGQIFSIYMYIIK